MKRGILETIGSPLVQVESPPGSIIAAKIESKNPGGSAKDRPALAMVEAAEAAGELTSGDPRRDTISRSSCRPRNRPNDAN